MAERLPRAAEFGDLRHHGHLLVKNGAIALLFEVGLKAAAQREHHGTGRNLQRALRCIKRERAIDSPTGPAVAHVKLHARATHRVTQAMQPRAQQGRGLHVFGKHTA